jgi:TolA-binding protein
MKHLEEIESYLDGNMTADERLRFEANLESDPDLKVEYEELEAIYNGFDALRAERELKQHLQKLEAEIQAEEAGARSKTISTRWKRRVGAAMIAAAASIALIWMLLPGKNGIDPELLPREMGLPVTMSANSHRFDAAMTAFKQGKYEEASIVLVAMPDAAHNDTVAYYLGLCSLHLGQLPESGKYFGSITRTSSYTLRAEFYLGLLHYQAGEKAEARAKLEPIAGQDSSEYGRKARLILSR